MPTDHSAFKHPRYSLLTAGTSSTKLDHEAPDGKWAIVGLHLAPANESGVNVCPWAGSCAAVCLNTAGRGRMDSVQQARIRRTKLLFSDPKYFLDVLDADIRKFVRACSRQGYDAAARLNMTSDIGWWLPRYTQRGQNLLQKWHHRVQFYDYTKRPVHAWPDEDVAPFYDLTFSHDPANDLSLTHDALEAGHNISVVFDAPKGNPLPDQWDGFEVIDGRTHDYRFLDPKGSKVVGLSALGSARGSVFAVAA